MSAIVEPRRDGSVVAERPTPGTPRPYEFPPVHQVRLENGVRVVIADLPGRPLISSAIILPTGAADEPDEHAGATVLAARALTEGTEQYDAIGLTEAAERLGASLHAEAGWDATSVSVDVPASRLEAALELFAEVLLHPTFPATEVDRLRDERLNDLLQARADPRRRADEAFIGTIYSQASPYHRPSGGTRETVERLDDAVLRTAYRRTLDPARATLAVAGDFGGQDVLGIAERLFGSWTAPAEARARSGPVNDEGTRAGRVVRVVHRPGAVQTEIRIGHPGLPRRISDYHAVSVMSAILGGLFNSRLNMQLREAKGYTYGAGAGFDMRRGAGPFNARAAVNTEVTVPAVIDTIAELERMRDTPVTEDELAAARDFLVGVFPLRFETSGAVVGALAGLAIHDLDLDELVDYRSRIEAVNVDAIDAAARAHLHVDQAAVVLVGDADAFGDALQDGGLGPVTIERDDAPVATGPRPETVVAAVDEEPDAGPTAGAEEPEPDSGTEPDGSETNALD